MRSKVISFRVTPEEAQALLLLTETENITVAEVVMDAVNARVPRTQVAQDYFVDKLMEQLKDMEAQYQLERSRMASQYETKRILMENRLINLRRGDERRVMRIKELLPRYLEHHMVREDIYPDNEVEWFKPFGISVTHQELRRLRDAPG